MGAEGFFLSTQATKVSHIILLDERGVIEALRSWWSSAPRASGLTRVAQQLWGAYALDQSIPIRGKKRIFQEAQQEPGTEPCPFRYHSLTYQERETPQNDILAHIFGTQTQSCSCVLITLTDYPKDFEKLHPPSYNGRRKQHTCRQCC